MKIRTLEDLSSPELADGLNATGWDSLDIECALHFALGVVEGYYGEDNPENFAIIDVHSGEDAGYITYADNDAINSLRIPFNKRKLPELTFIMFRDQYCGPFMLEASEAC